LAVRARWRAGRGYKHPEWNYAEGEEAGEGKNHDSDSDSMASIAGQLYGLAELLVIPPRWVGQLDVFQERAGLVESIAAWPFKATEITSAG
jgi:hypothetical protein